MPKQSENENADADAPKSEKTIGERLDHVIANGDAFASELAQILKDTIGK